MMYFVNYFKGYQNLPAVMKSGLVLFCLLMAGTCYSKDVGLQKAAGLRPFITTWFTGHPGSSNSNQITIPTIGTGYNYTIYWENTTYDTINKTVSGITGDYTITFPSQGGYRVEISGNFPRIYFNNHGDKSKIQEINQWGDIVWQSMGNAFQGCDNLAILATDSPDLSGVTDMSGMFSEAKYMNSPIGNWDVSKVTDMSNMFELTEYFNQPIDNWNVSNVTDMSEMFKWAIGFNQPIGSWNVGNVTNMSGMFGNALSFNQSLSSWNVSKVTDMNGLFGGAEMFDQPIGNWDVSKVTDMSDMFGGAEMFNQSLGNWDVSKVTNMRGMFVNTLSFNQPIGSWNVSSVSEMAYMFMRAKLFNQSIGSWNVSSVTEMANLFDGAELFNQPIGNWNVGNVTNMNGMFMKASNFNQPIGNWNVGKVTTMNGMFMKAQNFNQTIGAWDVSKVTDMEGMFSEANSFNQAIGNWDVSKVIHMEHMLDNTAISTLNYDLLLQGWIKNPNGLTRGDTLGADGLDYCKGAAARNALITKYNWVIEGDDLDCDALGTMDISETSAFKIYPNPAHDYIDIDLEEKSITDMSIIDMNGRQVLKINNDTQRVNISSLGSGVYYLVVRDWDKIMHYKIVKD